jgi:hypothetical protein
MTPVGGPPPQQQQVVGPPPPNGQIGMPPGQQMGGPPPGQGQSQVGSMHGAGPPRNGSQGNVGGWAQGNVSYGNVNSPANQPCYSSGSGSNQGGPMMMSDGSMMEVKSSPINGGDSSTPNPEEYILPGPFGQETNDQCDSAEIMKLKQSMQEECTTKMFEKEQSDFSLPEYSDSRTKWS